MICQAVVAAWCIMCHSDGERLERILENDLILKHDSIWPHGLNLSLHMDSLIELTEFRRSCLRHGWPPPDCDRLPQPTELDLDVVRRQLHDIHTDDHNQHHQQQQQQQRPSTNHTSANNKNAQ